MSTAPVICFGQQPCGFFPKRFLVAKILTARRLQSELGIDEKEALKRLARESGQSKSELYRALQRQRARRK